MNLKAPLLSYVISQKFGENDNNSYHVDGLKGHTGIDMVSSFNDVVSHACDGFCYKVINALNPNPGFYRSVYDLVDGGDGFWYEVSYGHLNKVLTESGVPVLLGQPLGTEGNTGEVFVNGTMVSAEDRINGSTAGFHLHFQVRKLRRVQVVDTACHYLSATDGTPIPYDNYGYYRDKDNYIYEVVDYENGYAGCVDPLPFLESPDIVVLPPSTPAEIQEKISIWQRLINWLFKRS